MTQLVASSIWVNVFVCNQCPAPRNNMLSAAFSSRQRQEAFFLVLRVCFMLYLADVGLLSSH